MIQAQSLARALNALTKSPQFSYVKARAAARKDENVDWPRTKQLNEGFNAEVDGCESFVMRDGSVCEWKSGTFNYAARAPRGG
ncbi:MAG: hypothetical protein ABSB70_08485 [Candidatus Velthaea sp.]